MTTNEQENPGYEKTDAAVRPILLTVGALLVGIAACLAVAGIFTRGFNRERATVVPAMSFQHGVVDDSTITRDWQAQDQLVREHLESYAWVDRPKGVARIPVARAMELLVAKDAQQRGGRR